MQQNFLKPCPEDYKKRQGTVSYLGEMLCKASNRCQLTGALATACGDDAIRGVNQVFGGLSAKHSCLADETFDNINVHPCWAGKLSPLPTIAYSSYTPL